jgi:hypothetical protein
MCYLLRELTLDSETGQAEHGSTSRAIQDKTCFGELSMCMIGCAGPPMPSKIRMYHTLVNRTGIPRYFTISPSTTVLM